VRVSLRYGHDGLEVDLPDHVTDVVEPHEVAAAADAHEELVRALRHPLGTCRLRDQPGAAGRIVVAVCDHTRPQPVRAMLLAILAELPSGAEDRLTVLVATGTHRASTPAELAAMFGTDLLALVRVENHDCRDDGLADLGVVDGDVPVHLSQTWVDADLRISTGFVEPHFFAGFSGGPKLVAPGLAGLQTVLALHDARRVGSPAATWGKTVGNPVHDAIRAAAARAPAHVALDVQLDRRHFVVRAVAGLVEQAHPALCDHVRSSAMRSVDGPYDVVVTTNAGHPLDQNLYQAVKGMRAAAQIVSPGGLVVCAAQCADGLPADSPFAKDLACGREPAALLAEIESSRRRMPEQWQLQVLATTLLHARVGLHASGLDDATIASCGLRPIADVGDAVRRELRSKGADARACVLPSGPETIPYIAPP
jgi:lactate racemase